MYRLVFGFIFLFGISICYSQDPTPIERDSTKVQDSLKNKIFLNHLGNGYFPTKYFNFDTSISTLTDSVQVHPNISGGPRLGKIVYVSIW